jgi:glucosamine-6-phosphate deaminase
MLEGFDYEVARWIPFRDREVCKRVRAIRREDITRHPNPHVKIEVIPNDQFPFRLVMGLFSEIKQAADEGRKVVLILPQPEPLYAWLAFLINKYRVDCRKLYTFNMDEYADQDGNIAPETWPNAFHYNMKKYFYGRLDKDLRPPESQIVGFTNKNFPHYGKMIEDLGGADVCHGGIGWSGHIAFIDPGTDAFPPVPLEEFKKIGPRIVELSPTTVLQGCLGPEFGQSGDWSWYPPKAATIGPAQVLGAKLRSTWCGFSIAGSAVSWQRFIIRLAMFGPVTPLVPASIIQTVPTELYITETLAQNIEPAMDFNWYG